jgi:hypothetical protein
MVLLDKETNASSMEREEWLGKVNENKRKHKQLMKEFPFSFLLFQHKSARLPPTRLSK